MVFGRGDPPRVSTALSGLAHPPRVPQGGAMADLEPRVPVGVRVGDAERERAASLLSEHYAAGRLTLTEFSERSDAAAHARTTYDLLRLTADLPSPSAVPAPVVAPRLPRVPPVLFADVFFGIVGPLAGLCLLFLLGASARGEFMVAFLAAMGGAVSFGAAVHFAHRAAGRGRTDPR